MREKPDELDHAFIAPFDETDLGVKNVTGRLRRILSGDYNSGHWQGENS